MCDFGFRWGQKRYVWVKHRVRIKKVELYKKVRSKRDYRNIGFEDNNLNLHSVLKSLQKYREIYPKFGFLVDRWWLEIALSVKQIFFTRISGGSVSVKTKPFFRKDDWNEISNFVQNKGQNLGWSH